MSQAWSPYYKALAPVPDEEDLALHARLCCPRLVTERLGQLVPLLKFVGFRVEEVGVERTVLTVPLLESAMNQNGTHQAAVFYLLADYTLGIGMFAHLPGCYTVGVHDRCRALPVQYWLKSGRVQHLAPGTGTIRGEVSLPRAAGVAMREQLRAKGRCEIAGTVRIFQGEELVAVAEHEMGLYADLPRIDGTRTTATQVHRLKTSALMIAGLRDDPLSRQLAGEQGVAIARRMTAVAPQLPGLVAARSQHLRAYLRGEGRRHEQVLVLGAGLDSKPLEFSTPAQRWFLCDLRDMLRERAARCADLGAPSDHCTEVPVDLSLSGWPEKILAAGFHPHRSTLVILEGVSMYLGDAQLRACLQQARGLCRHSGSRLWLDHVSEDLLSMPRPEVRSFLAAMARLGEPFVTGFADADTFGGADAGWRAVEHCSAAQVLGLDEPVHREYRFALLRPDHTDTEVRPMRVACMEQC
jgi:methyltransferase (TIGR00027 family)